MKNIFSALLIVLAAASEAVGKYNFYIIITYEGYNICVKFDIQDYSSWFSIINQVNFIIL